MTIAAHTNIIKLNLKALHKYSLFKKQDELNQNIWQYVELLRQYDVPQSVIDVLLNLGSRSLRVLGISFPKQSTIANDTQLSVRTVNRALKALHELQIIDSVDILNKWRKSGKVYRIKPFNFKMAQQRVLTVYGDKFNDINELTLLSAFEPYQKEPELLNNVTDKAVCKEIADIDVDIKDLTPFQRLKSFISNFTHDTSLTHRLYAAWKAIAADINDTDTLIRAVKVVMRALEDKVTSNPIGYFKGVVRKIWAKDSVVADTTDTDTTHESMTQTASSSNVNGKTEILPDWFNKQYVAPTLNDEEAAQLEADRQRVLQKLGLA